MTPEKVLKQPEASLPRNAIKLTELLETFNGVMPLLEVFNNREDMTTQECRGTIEELINAGIA